MTCLEKGRPTVSGSLLAPASWAVVLVLLVQKTASVVCHGTQDSLCLPLRRVVLPRAAN